MSGKTIALPWIQFGSREMFAIQCIVDTYGGALTFDGSLTFVLPEHSVDDLVEALTKVEMADVAELVRFQHQSPIPYNQRSEAKAA